MIIAFRKKNDYLFKGENLKISQKEMNLAKKRYERLEKELKKLEKKVKEMGLIKENGKRKKILYLYGITLVR